MIYEIKRGSTVLYSDLVAGQRREAIMGVDVVNATFTLNYYIDFLKGDTMLVNNELFTLSKPSDFKQDGKWTYSLNFLSEGYKLADTEMLSYDETGALNEYDCFFTGTADMVIDFIIANANKDNPGLWVKGVVDETETFDFDFTGDNCTNALVKVVDRAKTEFWIENRTIHLTKKGANSGLSFRRGKGQGLLELNRKTLDNKPVTRLRVYGSKQNLPATYPGLSKRLRMPNGQLFIKDEAKVVKYGLIPETIVFEDIFPKRTGTVTAVAGPLTFTDASIDFNINDHLVNKVSAKVKFITGQLAGYQFDIKENGYNHATKTITINVNKDEKAIEVPSATGLKAAVGDQYILIDVIMPQVDIDKAELELFNKATEKYNDSSDPRVQFDAPLDPKYLRDNNLNPKLGDFVNIDEPKAGIDKDIRVISKTTDLQDKYDVTIELGDTVSVANIVKQIIAQDAVQKAITNNKLNDINRARNNWRSTAELVTMLDTLRAEMLLIMVDGGAYSSNVTSSLSRDKFSVTAGTVQHEEYIQNGGVWNVPAFSENLTGGAKYVYIRANKSSTAATFVISEAKIPVEGETGFYHLPFGIISSVINNVRIFNTTKGYVRINGNNIQAGRITSTDGLTWFDLDAGEFRGKFSFTSGRDVEQTIVDKATAAIATAAADAQTKANSAKSAAEAAAKAYSDAQDNLKKIEAAAYADGKVSAEEARAIADATAKLNEAKADATSKATAAQTAATNAAALDAQAKANTAKLAAEAAAKVYSDAQDTLKKTEALAYADGKVTAEEQARISADTANLTAAKNDAQAKATAAQTAATNAAALDAQAKANTAKTSAETAAKTYSDAQDALRKIEAAAYADGKVSAEEARAIADANTKLQAAKDDATAKATAAQIAAVNAASTDAASKANTAKSAAESAAKTYSDAQDVLLKTQQQAYADGKVTAEEQARINQAAANLAIAKADSQAKADAAQAAAIASANADASAKIAALQIGARNYFLGGEPVRQYNLTTSSPVLQSGILLSSTPVAVGFEARVISGEGRNLVVKFSSNLTWLWINQTLTTEWVKYEGTVMLSATASQVLRLAMADAPAVVEFRKIMIVSGNKTMDFAPAPEDLLADAQSKADAAQAAAKTYSDAQDNLKKIEAAAYADGKVTAEEQRAINDATAKLAEAKADATAKANAAQTAAQSVSAADALTKAQNAQTAAQAAAKVYADAQDTLKKTEALAYADGKVTAEEQARINADTANLTAAKNDAQAKATAAQTAAINAAAADATSKANSAKSSAETAAKTYADAQDNLKKIEAAAYADGKVSAEEARAIADANTKLQVAKDDATAKAAAAQTAATNAAALDAQTKANTAKSSAEAAAKTYSDAQDTLRKIESAAYADGKVSAEEARAIADANAKLELAKNDAQTKATAAQNAAIAAAAADAAAKVGAVQIGGRNYYKKSTVLANLGNVADITKTEKGFTIRGNLNWAGAVRLENVITGNGWWTISGTVRVTSAAIPFLLDFADSPPFSVQAGTVAQKFQFSFNVTNYTSDIYHFIDLQNIGNRTYIFDDIMIVQGNKAFDYSPNPDDVAADIVAAKTYADQVALAQANIAKAAALLAASNDAGTKAEAARTAAISASNSFATTAANNASTAAQIAAAADASTKMNNAYNQAVQNAETARLALTNSLKSLAYLDVVELAKLGSTVVSGGKIKATLLDVAAIWANMIDAGYINAGFISALDVAFVKGKIGGFNIGADIIFAQNGTMLVEGYQDLSLKSNGEIEMSAIVGGGFRWNNSTQSWNAVAPTRMQNRLTPKTISIESDSQVVGEFKQTSNQNKAALVATAPPGSKAIDVKGDIYANDLKARTGYIILQQNGNGTYNGIQVQNGLIVGTGLYTNSINPPGLS